MRTNFFRELSLIAIAIVMALSAGAQVKYHVNAGVGISKNSEDVKKAGSMRYNVGSLNFTRPTWSIGGVAQFCNDSSRFSFSAGLEFRSRQVKREYITLGDHISKSEHYDFYSLSVPLLVNININTWLSVKCGVLYGFGLNQPKVLDGEETINRHVINGVLGADLFVADNCYIGLGYEREFNPSLELKLIEHKISWHFSTVSIKVGYIF